MENKIITWIFELSSVLKNLLIQIIILQTSSCKIPGKQSITTTNRIIQIIRLKAPSLRGSSRKKSWQGFVNPMVKAELYQRNLS